LRDNHVEGRIRKIQIFGIHDRESLDVIEVRSRDPFACLAQHLGRDIDTEDRIASVVAGKRQPGADADFQDPSANAFRGIDRRTAPGAEYLAEHQIINRRPFVISPHDHVFVWFRRHRRLFSDRTQSTLTTGRRPKRNLSAPIAAAAPLAFHW
jgi:hypothetical protein